MATTVLGIGIYQHGKQFAPPPATAAAAVTPIDQRLLRFVDQGDGVNAYGGHVRVYDGATGAELPQLRENDGFIKAVLNSLMYERTRRDLVAPPLFALALWPEGRLTLRDTASGAEVSLGAFGSANKAVFMRFLELSEARS